MRPHLSAFNTPRLGDLREKAIATVSLSGTLEEKLAAAAAAGFDGVEIFESDLIASPLSPAEVRRRAESLGLQIVLYQPFRDFEAVPAEAFARNLQRAEHKLRVMEELGVDLLLVCSNVSPDTIDDDALAASHLHELADRAAGRGIRIAYEALAWGMHVADFAHSWRIVEAADHPQLGVCLDSFHILSRGDDPTGIREIPGERIFFLQLADAPQLRMHVLQWSRHYRCFPGQGAFDLPNFVAHVFAAGYRGPLSLEIFNDVFRQANADRIAIDAMRSLLALEEAVDPAASSLPEPPRLQGYSFIELAVDTHASEHVEHLLAAMGFARPATLWQQGSIRVAAEEEAGAAHPGDVGISALAITSVDPALSALRADALLAPVNRVHMPQRLPEIVAPDGTRIDFVEPDAGAVPPHEPGSSSGLLTHIDHVALTQPFDYFDEATLFYRSVLGLHLHASQELAAPYGLVRSRAATTEDGSIRIALNVPLLGNGDSDGSLLAQHLAFACQDIFAVARAMREGGVAFLPISDNYYEDLLATLALDEGMVEKLREFDVLYDRNAEGEFMHFYTPMIGSRLFFEVVQRIGAYSGYGASNSAVRLAAQRRPDLAGAVSSS